MINKLKTILSLKKKDTKSIRSTGSVARFLREAPAKDQKKVFMKAIDESIKKQQEVIRRAEMMPAE